MKGFSEFKINTEKLIKSYSELKKKNAELEEKLGQVEKNLSYLENKNQNLPDIMLKNKKLLKDREKIENKVDSLLKRLEEVKI
ncbi:hypothetical protein ACFLUV_00035 [Elusimicrobiota bacterium]